MFFLQPSHSAQLLHLALPHLTQVLLLFIAGNFGDFQYMSFGQLAHIDAQFKIGLRSLIEPMETNVYAFAAAKQLGLSCFVLTP